MTVSASHVCCLWSEVDTRRPPEDTVSNSVVQYLVKTVCAHLHQKQQSTQAVSLLATVSWAVCTYIINVFKRNSKIVRKIT